METLEGLSKILIELWPMAKADGSFLFLLLVMISCAILLWLGNRKIKEDREHFKKKIDELQKEILEIQKITDILVEHHCKNHEEAAFHFRRRLSQPKEEKPDAES